jgi:hypothetical protein
MLLDLGDYFLIITDVAVGHKTNDANMLLRVGRVERRLEP